MFDSIIILGATATGKTDIAISVAKKLNAEIINADSMYIYKDFNIGTAKPTVKEMQGIPHHLIDICNPLDSFSVADYKALAIEEINKLNSKNILPIIVGGTGFYIDSLIKSYTYGNTEKNEKLRLELEIELKEKGKEYIFERLKKLDIKTANKLHPNDTNRVIRAIEIALTSSSKKSEIENTSAPVLKNPLIIGLELPRNILYEKINLRVDKMIDAGLIDEVNQLLNLGYTPDNCNAMKGIGYQELYKYKKGEMNYQDTIEKIKQHTRNYAKRQITWFKRCQNVHWMDARENNIIDLIVNLYNESI